MGQLTLPAAQVAQDQAGTPVAYAQMYLYHAGSDVQSQIFQDYHLTLPFANPVIADETGAFPVCHLVEGRYRVKITTPKEETLLDQDAVLVESGSGGEAVAGGTGFATVAHLITDRDMTYAADSSLAVSSGDFVTTVEEGFVYQVADASASDAEITTAGGVKLYVRPLTDGSVSDRQFAHIENDADRVNAAIAWTIARQKTGHGVGRVLVSGEYVMDKPIKAFDFDGTLFRYASVHLEAPAHGYVSNQRTTFTFTDGQNPGIVTQKIRQLTLKNISIVGAANDLLQPSYDDLLQRNGWWNTNGAAEDSPFRLHAGICIDPFHSGMDAAQKFSYFDGSGDEPDHYKSPTGSGSTQVLVQSCDVQGWIVGVMCASSAVQIGDSITVEKCNLSYNRWPFFLGESQNRGCAMVDCHAKAFDTLMVGGNGFGMGTGSLAYIRGGVFVFGHSIVGGNVDRGNGAITDAYFESIWAIGHIDGQHGFSFNDCQIKLIDARNSGLPDVDAHLTGTGSVNFFGGYVGKYTNHPRRLKLVPSVHVSGTSFDAVPTFRDYTKHNLIHMKSRYTGADVRQSYAASSFSTAFNNPQHGPGARINVGDEVWLGASDWAAKYFGLGTATVAGDGTATVTGLDTATLKIGDEVAVLNGWAGLNNKGESDTHRRISVGYVEAVDAGTVSLSAVPISFASGSYSFYLWHLPLIHPITFGDLTNGSNEITNVTAPISWRVGDWVQAAGLPNDTRITAKDGNTLTVSKAATTSATNVELYDSRLVLQHKYRSAAPTSGIYPRGAVVQNSAPTVDGNGNVLTGWICTEGGAPGLWEPLYHSTTSSA